jgi:two-component system, OmpR family, KDP operon response regulator KdpE
VDQIGDAEQAGALRSQDHRRVASGRGVEEGAVREGSPEGAAQGCWSPHGTSRRLPDLDGMEVCNRVRTWSDVPIIVLSADSTEDRKVEALDGGADDYLTKPFGMRELSARLRVALRRRAHSDEETGLSELTVGPLQLDLVHYQAWIDGKQVDLTAREFEFLAFLARHAGKVCTRRMILENVWGPGYASEVNYLKVYAYRIRKKLGDEAGRFPQSNPALGYRLAWPASDQDAEPREP